jgi:hypothetical protein
LKEAEEKWNGYNHELHPDVIEAEQALANQNK